MFRLLVLRAFVFAHSTRTRTLFPFSLSFPCGLLPSRLVQSPTHLVLTSRILSASAEPPAKKRAARGDTRLLRVRVPTRLLRCLLVLVFTRSQRPLSFLVWVAVFSPRHLHSHPHAASSFWPPPLPSRFGASKIQALLPPLPSWAHAPRQRDCPLLVLCCSWWCPPPRHPPTYPPTHPTVPLPSLHTTAQVVCVRGLGRDPV